MTPSASTSDEDLGEFEEFTLPEGAAEGEQQDEKPSDDSVRPFEGGREESAVKESGPATATASRSSTRESPRRFSFKQARDDIAAAGSNVLSSVISGTAAVTASIERSTHRRSFVGREHRKSTSRMSGEQALAPAAAAAAHENALRTAAARNERLHLELEARAAWEARTLAFLAAGNARLPDGTAVSRWIKLQQALRDAVEKGKPLDDSERALLKGAADTAIRSATHAAKEAEAVALKEYEIARKARMEKISTAAVIEKMEAAEAAINTAKAREAEIKYASQYAGNPNWRAQTQHRGSAVGRRMSLFGGGAPNGQRRPSLVRSLSGVKPSSPRRASVKPMPTFALPDVKPAPPSPPRQRSSVFRMPGGRPDRVAAKGVAQQRTTVD